MSGDNRLVGTQAGLALCVCTYKRPQLLELLLRDVLNQTIQPGVIIIVDGDPSSGQVLEMLQNAKFPSNIPVYFIPSNHAGLSYQRYLGWRVAETAGTSLLLYLDDDLRINQQDVIEKLVGYLQTDPDIVGATGVIKMGEMKDKFVSHPVLLEHYSTKKRTPYFVRLLGSAWNIPPGGLTPAGDRVLPVQKGDYSNVQWLHGGVMLFRMGALMFDSFSPDLFALNNIHCGKGEDTFLSRQVMKHGNLIYVHDILVDHPNSDLPTTYPISAYKLAYAIAYSRRFLNNHYRINRPPYLTDRLALLKVIYWK